jgi:hypothetical protein
MATKVNKDGKKPPSAATNLIGEPQLLLHSWPARWDSSY